MAASIKAVNVVATGAAAPAVVFANKLLLAIVAKEMVPVPVTGPPVNPVPVATLVTVPPPPGEIQERFPVASVERTVPAPPSAVGSLSVYEVVIVVGACSVAVFGVPCVSFK